MRAHFFPYSSSDKHQVRSDLEYCLRHGWTYLSDLQITPQQITSVPRSRYRVGGHANPDEFFQFLTQLYQVQPHMLTIPVHGEKRGTTAKLIQAHIAGTLGIHPGVVARMDKGSYMLDLFTRETR